MRVCNMARRPVGIVVPIFDFVHRPAEITLFTSGLPEP
jgi:hypothetical protein